MRSEPYHDELHTFRGDTKQRRHRRNGGSSCAMDERRCGQDMMIKKNFEANAYNVPVPESPDDNYL